MFGTEETLEHHSSKNKSTLYTDVERESIEEGISKCIERNNNIVNLEEALYNLTEDKLSEELEEQPKVDGFSFSWISKLLNSFESAIDFISELSDTIASKFIGTSGDIVYALVWMTLFIVIVMFFSILALACTLGSIVLSVLK